MLSISIGTTIHGYRVLAELASGQSSHVFLGESLSPRKQLVVIKLLDTLSITSEQDRDHFFQEAHALKALHHPNILPIWDIGIDTSLPYIITEYEPDSSLHKRIQHSSPQPLPIAEAQTIITQIGQALSYAHQRDILHGNLKPQNILLNAKGDAFLADFALFSLTGSPKNADTSLYMAPEQFSGTISKESDQYALACIAYELFTGHTPFTTSYLYRIGLQYEAETPLAPTQRNPLLPLSIEQALLKAMAQEPTQRYPDISAFITTLNTSTTVDEDEQANATAITLVPSIPQHTLESHLEEPLLSTVDTVSSPPPAMHEASPATPFIQERLLTREGSVDAHLPGIANGWQGSLIPKFFANPQQENAGAARAILPGRALPPVVNSRGGRYGKGNRLLKHEWLLVISCILVVLGLGGTLVVALTSTPTPKAISKLQSAGATISSSFPTTSTTSTTNTTATVRLSPTPTRHTATILMTPGAAPSSIPTAAPTPTATPSPAGVLTVSPSQFTPINCVPDKAGYICTALLSLRNSYQGSLKWYAYSNGVEATFDPKSGTLSANRQIQQIIISVHDACKHSGFFIFSDLAGQSVSASWSC